MLVIFVVYDISIVVLNVNILSLLTGVIHFKGNLTKSILMYCLNSAKYCTKKM